MKKLFVILAAIGVLGTTTVNAQEQAAENQTETVAADSTATEEAAPAADFNAETDVEGEPMHQILKQKVIEGDAMWMAPVILCLIFGLAIAIERIIYLNLCTTNTKKLLEKVEAALNEGGVEAAKKVCAETRGPVASIFWQGLDRYNQGLDSVEKAIVSYGSVQMGQMENGLTWIGLFISIASMLGFMGTVVGMIGAFDSIQAAGDISPTLVAGGIKVALLTTLAGLIVAVILQLFYSYIVAKIDGLVNTMEDASISFTDILTKYSAK